MNVIRDPACLVVNPFTINNFAPPFNFTPVCRAGASDLMKDPT